MQPKSALGDMRGKAEPKNARSEMRPDESASSVGFVAAALGAHAAEEAQGRCRPGMVSIDDKFCIDKYEAALLEIVNGEEKPFSPYAVVSDAQHVRAVSFAHVVPQGYISRNQAEKACMASGKRLCDVAEWQKACRGPEKKQWGYGDNREVGRCNDNGKNPVMTYYGPRYDATTMNKPELNQMDGTLSKTGEKPGCVNGYGVHDMVGNLHEWVADPHGSFYGGYYQDVASTGHGEGCSYKTTAHNQSYHDYSTGFRCCADFPGGESSVTVSPASDPPKSEPTPARAKPKKKIKKKKR
ncbi:MAG: SUMF1/EgtB/PvdO family nonheme iron enzyme [Labilithrix sp.]|nr:SUMF1/EgtB/PvdO family nonheme iron enzyme [Labilithrix sp.]MCW5816646.1 SUMF1/EgtB/PvdO family nonheme iron enzyme [Labilithrix sp.]